MLFLLVNNNFLVIFASQYRKDIEPRFKRMRKYNKKVFNKQIKIENYGKFEFFETDV